MALIDKTYFNGELAIAGIADGNSPVVGNTIDTSFIPNGEDEYLRKALGYPLYEAFINGLEEDEPEQKWIDLRDGKAYEVGEESFQWRGFINGDKVSPVAYYVYCDWMRANASQVTGTGVAVNNKQNATSVSPADKIAVAWVKMKRLNADLWHFLKNNSDTYGEYNSCRIDFDSLLGSYNQFGI